MRRLANLILIAALLEPLPAAARRRAAPAPLTLDIARSFVITDSEILSGFSFERVMRELTQGTATTPLALYQQWFDTQNPPQCQEVSFTGAASYDGFARRCPTPEGALARTDPFATGEYAPVAIVNRFDLASATTCGEIRVLFARRGLDPLDRLNISFERVLPNHGSCRDVAQLWTDLTRLDSAAERRGRLEQLFFGSPVEGMHIRTFQHTNASGTSARMYQFRIERSGEQQIVHPEALENSPPSGFFDASRPGDIAARFREEFLRQVPRLAIDGTLDIPREFLVTEDSAALDSTRFDEALADPAGQEFQRRIAEALAAAGSDLTPYELIRRAESLTCTGCHAASGAPDGSHIGPGSTLSPALRDTFLPQRIDILRRFLQSK